MAISDKLTRINQAKLDIKEALDTSNNKIEEYAELVDKYVQNQPVSISSDGVCANTYDVPCKEFVVNGNSEQDGTPTPDSPVAIEVVKGKNIANITGGWGWGTQVTNVIENQVATINGTVNTDFGVGWHLNNDNLLLKANHTYTVTVFCNGALDGGTGYRVCYFNGINIGNVPIDNKAITYIYTPTKDTQVMYFNFDMAKNWKFTDYKVNIQLEEGTTATTYLPYNTIEIEQRGKNLLDKEDGEISSWVSIDITNLIKLNSMFYISADMSNIEFSGSTVAEMRVDYKVNSSAKYIYGSTLSADGKIYVSGTISSFDEGTNVYLIVKNINSATYKNWFFTYTSDYTYEPYQTPRTYQIPLGENYLANVGSVQDKLVISRNGKCKIDDNILHISSYNGETITTDYMSTTGQLTTGAEIYYVSNTPTEIELDNVQIDMFEGTNIFTLDTGLDTDFEVEFITKEN